MSTRGGVSQETSGELPEAIRRVAETVDELKATDLLVLDLREVASFTDFLVICTGSSDRHVQAMADAVRNNLRAVDVEPLHTEGYERATWVLVDFVDFLVNVFTAEARDFYQLERVWRDAPVMIGERPEVSSDPGSAGEDAAADAKDAGNDAEEGAGDAADG